MGRMGDLVLAYLDAEVWKSARLGVTVHRRVEQLTRIRLLIADNQALVREHRDREPRRSVVFIVEHAHLPRPLLFRPASQTRREAVQREKECRRGLAQQ